MALASTTQYNMNRGHSPSLIGFRSYQPVSNVPVQSYVHTGHPQSSGGFLPYNPVSYGPAQTNVPTGYLQSSGAVPAYYPAPYVPALPNVHTGHPQSSGGFLRTILRHTDRGNQTVGFGEHFDSCNRDCRCRRGSDQLRIRYFS